MEILNFWELNYILYLLGFLFVPRIVIIVIFSSYVTKGFEWYNIFVGITIWWKYAALGFGFWSKLGFMMGCGLFPRLLLGIIGYNSLPDNHTAMIILCVIGLVIDLLVKLLSSQHKEG